jgi:hypothetical protein
LAGPIPSSGENKQTLAGSTGQVGWSRPFPRRSSQDNFDKSVRAFTSATGVLQVEPMRVGSNHRKLFLITTTYREKSVIAIYLTRDIRFF